MDFFNRAFKESKGALEKDHREEIDLSVKIETFYFVMMERLLWNVF